MKVTTSNVLRTRRAMDDVAHEIAKLGQRRAVESAVYFINRVVSDLEMFGYNTENTLVAIERALHLLRLDRDESGR